MKLIIDSKFLLIIILIITLILPYTSCISRVSSTQQQKQQQPSSYYQYSFLQKPLPYQDPVQTQATIHSRVSFSSSSTQQLIHKKLQSGINMQQYYHKHLKQILKTIKQLQFRYDDIQKEILLSRFQLDVLKEVREIDLKMDIVKQYVKQLKKVNKKLNDGIENVKDKKEQFAKDFKELIRKGVNNIEEIKINVLEKYQLIRTERENNNNNNNDKKQQLNQKVKQQSQNNNKYQYSQQENHYVPYNQNLMKKQTISLQIK